MERAPPGSERGRFFPVGRYKGGCVGGYLSSGGFGGNGRRLGPACRAPLVDAEQATAVCARIGRMGMPLTADHGRDLLGHGWQELAHLGTFLPALPTELRELP